MMVRRFFSSLLLAVIILVATPLSAGAFDPFGHACEANGTGSAVACKSECAAAAPDSNCDQKHSISKFGPRVLLLNVTDLVAILAGALAVIMIIAGALRYIAAGSDVSTGSRTDTDAEEARRTIATALLGLLVIILARTIIFYVVSRL
jgi:Type IV secretion system pilin